MTDNPISETVAAVDLGSNSFHMIVCRVSDGRLQVVDKLREMVRLADGLDKDKNLSPEAQARALACLQRFGQRVAGIPRGSVRAVGTNTLRTARTSGDFLAEAEQALGHPIEIISGVEEARIIYLGVAHSTAASDEPRLVIDIGGGSTELIIGKGFQPQTMESLYMGCVSMSKRFFADGKLSRKRLHKAELAALQELEPVVTRFDSSHWLHAIGASGTARSIAKVMNANGWCENCIHRDGFAHVLDAMAEAGHIDELELAGLSDDRRPVFAGGLIILHAAFKALGIERMQVSDGALREGLIHDLFGRIRHEDVRDGSVRALAKRYHVEAAQAKRVSKTARNCLSMVSVAWGLTDPDWQQWLNWAARLYEIGLDIAHSQYQKHGAYILANADLAGFSQQEQELLATLVRGHRRKLSGKYIKLLPEHWQTPALRLTVLLRLAITLHRNRTDQVLPPFQLLAEGDRLTITLPDAWLEQHPLLQVDLAQEIEFIAPSGMELVLS